MDRQTPPVTGNGAAHPATRMRHGLAEFAHDLISLGELQAQLFVLDLRELLRRVLIPVSAAAAGAILFLGSVPVLLAAAAYWLAAASDLTLAASLALIAGCAIIVSLVILVAAWIALRSSLNAIDRSREELIRNVRWIKTALKQSTR